MIKMTRSFIILAATLLVCVNVYFLMGCNTMRGVTQDARVLVDFSEELITGKEPPKPMNTTYVR